MCTYSIHTDNYKEPDKDRYLLILDINGVLCDTIKYNNESKRIRRKHVTKFLDKCYKKYDIAFFSSMTKHNFIRIINRLLTKNQINNTVFFWHRDYTDPDPNGKKWDTIKNLSKVKLLFPSYKKMLICDDSFSKIRFNQPCEILIVDKLTDSNTDIYFDNLFHSINTKFEDSYVL